MWESAKTAAHLTVEFKQYERLSSYMCNIKSYVLKHAFGNRTVKHNA